MMATKSLCSMLCVAAFVSIELPATQLFAQDYRQPTPRTKIYPVGYWEFNGKEWVYQNGGQSSSSSSPLPGLNNPKAPSINQNPILQKQKPAVPNQTQPIPNNPNQKQPNNQFPKQPNFQQSPYNVFPPTVPYLGGAAAKQSQHWVVLYRECTHVPWRRYNCYGNECAAYDAAYYLSRCGYYAAIACD